MINNYIHPVKFILISLKNNRAQTESVKYINTQKQRKINKNIVNTEYDETITEILRVIESYGEKKVKAY